MNNKHSDSIYVHRLHRWVFATSAKRIAGIETVSLSTTLDATANTLTNAGLVVPNEIIYFSAVPAACGLSTATAYYVIAASTPDFFKVSLTLGGSAIDLLTSGAAVINEISVTFSSADIGKRGYDVATTTYWDITSVSAGVPTWLSANGEIIPLGTTSQILQGDKTWIEKTSLPVSTAVQTELTTLGGKVVPTGGLLGQSLLKASAADNDTYWGSSTIQNTRLLSGASVTINAEQSEYTKVIQLSSALVLTGYVLSNQTLKVVASSFTNGVYSSSGAAVTVQTNTLNQYSIVRITNTTALIVYYSGARILTVSGTTITVGAEFALDTTATSISVCRVSNNKFAMSYRIEPYSWARIINVSGSLITFGTPLQCTNYDAMPSVIRRISDTAVLVSARIVGGTGYVEVYLLNIDSDVLTLKDTLNTGLTSTDTYPAIAVEIIAANKYLLMFFSSGTLRASTITRTGDTLSLDGLVNLGTNGTFLSSCAYNSDVYVTFLNSADVVSIGKVAITNDLAISTVFSVGGGLSRPPTIVNLDSTNLVVSYPASTAFYINLAVVTVETTEYIHSDNKHLTIIDETGGVIVVNTENNSLPVIDETGATLFVDLVVSEQETVHTFTTYTTSHTLTLDDASTISNSSPIVEMNVATANTLTIPPNSSVGFVIGSKIDVVQIGTGQTTITPGSGVTIYGTPGLKLRAQYSGVTLIKKAIDTWYALGDLSA